MFQKKGTFPIEERKIQRQVVCTGGTTLFFGGQPSSTSISARGNKTTLGRYLTKEMFKDSQAFKQGTTEEEFPSLIEQDPVIAKILPTIMMNLVRSMKQSKHEETFQNWTAEDWVSAINAKDTHTYLFMNEYGVVLGCAQMKFFSAGEGDNYPYKALPHLNYVHIKFANVLNNELEEHLFRKLVLEGFRRGFEVITFDIASHDESSSTMHDLYGCTTYRIVDSGINSSPINLARAKL